MIDELLEVGARVERAMIQQIVTEREHHRRVPGPLTRLQTEKAAAIHARPLPEAPTVQSGGRHPNSVADRELMAEVLAIGVTGRRWDSQVDA